MTSQEVDLLKIYVLLSLGVVWPTGWMDCREQRRRPAE